MADMITTDSGLQYEILVDGSGATPGPYGYSIGSLPRNL